MLNGKLNGALPGKIVRDMADAVAQQAMGIAEGTDERVKEIQRIATNAIGQLNDALERYQAQNRDNAAKLAEAVLDQFGMLAQKVEDLTTHCDSATKALAEHRQNITQGLAALREPVPLPAEIEAKLPPVEPFPEVVKRGPAVQSETSRGPLGLD